MTGTAKRPTQYWLLIGLIAAASAVRIFICFQHNPMDSLSSDMLRHWTNGLYFPFGGYTGAADPIGYQVYVFVVQHATRGNRLLVALSAALLSVTMPWTYYRAARDFGLSKISALWVWALIAWAPSLATIYHFIMAETLLLWLDGVALWMTARYLRKGGGRDFLDFVFCWGLACLTKPTMLPLAGICFLWVWWKKATPVRQLLLGAALAFVMLLPQAVRSKVVLGFVAPFGNSWLTRIQLRSGARVVHFHVKSYAWRHRDGHSQLRDEELEFGSPSCFIQPLEPLSPWAMRRAWGHSRAWITIDASHGARDWKAAYDRFNDDNDLDQWLVQWRENIILFFFAPSWPESSVPEWDGRLDYYSRWIWAPLILFVFVGNAREFVKRRFHLIPVATTIFTLVLIFQNLLIMEGRYRKVVEPLLLMNLVWVIAGMGKKETESDGLGLSQESTAVKSSPAPASLTTGASASA